MGKYNSWMKSALSKINKRAAKSPITKVGEKLGAPIRKSIEGYFSKKKEEKYKAKMVNKSKLEKAKEAYLEKYGKPYNVRTATVDETNNLEEFFN